MLRACIAVCAVIAMVASPIGCHRSGSEHQGGVPLQVAEQSKEPSDGPRAAPAGFRGELGGPDSRVAQSMPVPPMSGSLSIRGKARAASPGLPAPQAEGYNRDAYDHSPESAFQDVLAHPRSTFSIDVDTASYSNIRRFISDGMLPPAGAVRVEELVNYFDYKYPVPADEHPFSVSLDAATCPWNDSHQLVRIGLASQPVPMDRRPPCNLVFLLDVSGSMQSADKLGFVKSAMQMLTRQLNGDDQVAMVVYAGASGLVLPSTSADDQKLILEAIDRLAAGGSTNGGAGIRLAYQVAREHFVENGINRVILCTDGDFNVGTTSQSELVDLIETGARSGVFLSVFGFGRGNLNDSTMEKLADKGNGVYGYVDTLNEARRLMVDQVGATLITVARDVKIQVDFNPRHITAWRLVGYENRTLATEDFDDDRKDAGEIGAGHRVTAFYEVVPAGAESPARTAAPSRFVHPVTATAADSDVMLAVDLRYKLPDGDTSRKFTRQLNRDELVEFADTAGDFRFAAAVAAYGMILRQSEFAGQATLEWVRETAAASKGPDKQGIRNEFVQMVATTHALFGEQRSGPSSIAGPARNQASR